MPLRTKLRKTTTLTGSSAVQSQSIIAATPTTTSASPNPQSSSSAIIVDVEGERTFPRFPDLPTELRFKIWRYAGYNNPRLIVAFFNPGMSTFQFTKTPVPTLFHVSHEARREAMRSYTATDDGKKKTRSSQTIYISPSVDTILIRISLEGGFLQSQRRIIRQAISLNPSQPFDGVKGVGCMKVIANIYNDPDSRRWGWSLIFVVGKVKDNLDDLVEGYQKKYLQIDDTIDAYNTKRSRAYNSFPP